MAKSRQAITQIFPQAKSPGKRKTGLSPSDEEWRAIFDSLSDVVMILDKDFRITMANKAAAEFLGLSDEKITGKYCYQLLHNADGPIAHCPLVKMLESQKPEESELYLDAKGIWTRITTSPPFNLRRKNAKVVHIIRNISSQKMVDDTLQKRIKELNCLYDLSRLIESKDNAVEEIFEGALKLLCEACQYPDIVVARLVCEDKTFATPEWRETPWLLSQDISISGKNLGCLQVAYLEERSNQSGESFLEEEKNLARAVAERLAHVMERHRTDAALRESEERYRVLSIRDPLTGLFNRRYMEESLKREILRAERKKTPISIAMADIDRFKHFNDTYGHGAGDELLARVGDFLKAKIRGADVSCRYGGDEFTLILPESTVENTCKRMDHIREEIQCLDVCYQGKRLAAITLSFGISTYPDHGTDSETLLGAADAALYRAKQEGRNRIIVS